MTAVNCAFYASSDSFSTSTTNFEVDPNSGLTIINSIVQGAGAGDEPGHGGSTHFQLFGYCSRHCRHGQY